MAGDQVAEKDLSDLQLFESLCTPKMESLPQAIVDSRLRDVALIISMCFTLTNTVKTIILAINLFDRFKETEIGQVTNGKVMALEAMKIALNIEKKRVPKVMMSSNLSKEEEQSLSAIHRQMIKLDSKSFMNHSQFIYILTMDDEQEELIRYIANFLVLVSSLIPELAKCKGSVTAESASIVAVAVIERKALVTSFTNLIIVRRSLGSLKMEQELK